MSWRPFVERGGYEDICCDGLGAQNKNKNQK